MLNDKTLSHEIAINAKPEFVLRALNTVAGLQAWHTEKVSGGTKVGEQIQMHMPHGVQFVWEVLGSDSNAVMWRCVSGPGSSPGTEVDYRLMKLPDGRTRVTMVHRGWSSHEGNFNKCNTLWGALLHHLKTHCESGKNHPAI
jgi:hypothetical protein